MSRLRWQGQCPVAVECRPHCAVRGALYHPAQEARAKATSAKGHQASGKACVTLGSSCGLTWPQCRSSQVPRTWGCQRPLPAQWEGKGRAGVWTLFGGISGGCQGSRKTQGLPTFLRSLHVVLGLF